MKISVFGLGYVGVITAACLAEEGHDVIGVDVVDGKVDSINSGQAPIIEVAIGDLIDRGVKRGKLRAIKDPEEAVSSTDMAIVCVGTPSLANGALDQRSIQQVLQGIGRALATHREPFLVVMRSTIVPGTMHNLVIPTLREASGKEAGDGYDVVFHPEFLREGSSVYDFYNPPKIVVGERAPNVSEPLLRLYGDKFQAPRIVCELQVAEMVKYCDNLYHAVKVTFANEIGQYCHALNIDSREVMDIFCEDRKLNISASYLKPGFAFGGSCLPKDMRAFLAVAKEKDISLPMLQNILPSNLHQIERVLRMVLDTGASSIGFYGIAFKKGTDDLRESPFVELAERLLGKGKGVVCFDQMVQVSRLVGRNKSYVESKLPHLAELVTDRSEDLLACELNIVCHVPDDKMIEAWRARGTRLFDLTGFGLKDSGLDFEGVVTPRLEACSAEGLS